MDETALARETHAMEHANNIYKKLHDLDYFLLRYGPTDMGVYVEDPSTVSKYYGTLSYYGEDAAKLAEPEPAESVEPEAPEEPAEPDKPVTTYDAPSGETLAMIRREFAAIWPEDNITDRTPILFGNKDLILRHGGTILPDNDPDAAQKPRTQTDSAAYKTWRAANPSPTAIPLYDSEGKIIGSYDYGAGADLDFSGMDIEEAKAAAEALFDAQNAE